MGRSTFKAGNVSVDMFFDRAKVLDRLHKKEISVLNRTGGESRNTVKRSMRPGGKKGKSSEPGEPPRYQTKKLRDAIVYGYDEQNHSVVIGPLKARAKAENVPHILEYGGTVPNALVRVVEKTGKRKKDTKYKYVRKTVKIAPRPYVGLKSVNYPKMIGFLKKNIAQQKLL